MEVEESGVGSGDYRLIAVTERMEKTTAMMAVIAEKMETRTKRVMEKRIETMLEMLKPMRKRKYRRGKKKSRDDVVEEHIMERFEYEVEEVVAEWFDEF